MELLVDDRLRCAAERSKLRQHLIQHDSQGIDIRAAVGFSALAKGLLRRHVAGRSDDRAFGGDRLFRGELLGDSEVGDERLSVSIQDDVGRLEVPMDDALLMCVIGGASDDRHQMDGPIHLEPAACQFRFQVLPVYELAGDEDLAVLDADFIDRDNVRVIELGRGPRFAQQPGVMFENLGQLQRHLAGEISVPCQPDISEATAAQPPPQLKMRHTQRRRMRRKGRRAGHFLTGERIAAIRAVVCLLESIAALKRLLAGGAEGCHDRMNDSMSERGQPFMATWSQHHERRLGPIDMYLYNSNSSEFPTAQLTSLKLACLSQDCQSCQSSHHLSGQSSRLRYDRSGGVDKPGGLHILGVSLGGCSMGVRAGRFKAKVGDDGTAVKKIKIVEKRLGQLYRVYNPIGGRLSSIPGNPYRVEYGATSNPIVPLGSTLDFFVPFDLSNSIWIAHQTEPPPASSLEDVRGMYDCVTNEISDRSGRFRFNDSAPHMLIDLSLAGSSIDRATYRFLNSGDVAFKIFRSGTPPTEIAEVETRRSFDVTVDTGDQIAVKRPASATSPIRGIYELVSIDK